MTAPTDPGLDAATQRVRDVLEFHVICNSATRDAAAEAVARAAREDVADTIREARAIAGMRSSSPTVEDTDSALCDLTATAQRWRRERDEARQLLDQRCAEVEGLVFDLNNAAGMVMRDHNRAGKAEAELAALKSGIEALADDPDFANGHVSVVRVRALLAPPSTPSSPVSATGAPEGTPGGSEAQETRKPLCWCGIRHSKKAGK